ncbi:MAG: bifunctional 4-hydroxy-3-methylbut-2-enyl diphosphate reductase/30S ribosomal protein S1 [Clostridia bacterium]|nr:bifunctional 4-hydroxy-3-methylbut-2-enyl diphosphate reductase/30S ribosomal protein S1 [Clostridia bacterium]
MEIILAKTAGFCFGVNKAVSCAYEQLNNSSGNLYTYGPIIHNEQVVEQLKAKGMRIANNTDDIKGPGSVVIRAHGVSPDVYEEIKAKGVEVIDATCPYVKKIHLLVNEKHKEGYQIIIVGDKNHPEVIGINGWCDNTALIADTPEDVEKISRNKESKPVCVVAQTTITSEKWHTINEYLKKVFENIIKFDTICNATSKRQDEAFQLSQKVDMMLVVGSKNSSNTQKLFEICRRNCSQTFNIETSGDLPPMNTKKIKTVGITAGASTPDWIIKEVLGKMEELNKQENEMSFKEAFENSLVTLQTGQIVKGKIIGFNNAEVYIDMGYKSDGVIPVDEFSDDPDFNPETSLKVGEEVEVFVVRVNDGEGNVVLSKKKVDSIRNWDKMEEAYENKTPVNAKVVEVVKGGVIASAGGVRIFIPASQISDRFVKDLKEFLKQPVTLRITEFNKQKRKIVGSQRVILAEEKSNKINEVWENIEIGRKYSGVVKSLTDFGAFVDIGGVDGLIHISELSWTKIKHPSEVLKIGDKVEVSIQEFDKEKNRISLAYRKNEDNPWFNAEEKFKVGQIVKGKVVRLVPFGAFVEIQDGVDGLVHISQISSVRIGKPSDVLEVGMMVEAKIIEVNLEAKKISLSIKEVAPINPVNVKQEEKEGNSSKAEENTSVPDEVIPTEHKEDMNLNIGELTGNNKKE